MTGLHDELTGARVIHLSLDDPDTLRRLITSGLVWRVPAHWGEAITRLREGDIPLSECVGLPDSVRHLLTDGQE